MGPDLQPAMDRRRNNKRAATVLLLMGITTFGELYHKSVSLAKHLSVIPAYI
jgi:hypothetical protein